ncbi:MAG: hypothetical protein GY943_34960 [Chloroflexi bacterium]|nr:hypothetical protein [Chloroflexota bacterium]
MLPYFLTALLYLSLAILAAFGSSFSSLQILPWFNGMVWLRVHLITLGAITQILFGILPALLAIQHNQSRPPFRWDIWTTLNGGILTLLVGIPLVNRVPILAGGTLVFIATILLIVQLAKMRPQKSDAASSSRGSAGQKFYLAGLGYFLIGIIVGTGMWIGWAETLSIAVPVEVHIHANNWGLLSLVFAGLLVDYYEVWLGRPLHNPKSITPIFWLMTIGAFGLVFGPWFSSQLLLVPGLILHLVATGWLLFNVIKPVWKQPEAQTIGFWHLVTSYIWFLMPVLMAPLVLFKVPGIPVGIIEANAPQALIYGWVLQFAFAIFPYFFMRVFLPNETPKLGGSRFSLVAIHVGGVFLWASIFIRPVQGTLHGIAYLAWTVAMWPVVADLWQIARKGLSRLEDDLAIVQIGD